MDHEADSKKARKRVEDHWTPLAAKDPGKTTYKGGRLQKAVYGSLSGVSLLC